MKQSSGFKTARRSFVFLGALIVAFTVILSVENTPISNHASSLHFASSSAQMTALESLRESTNVLDTVDIEPLGDEAKLREWGGIAWKYFENNIDPETGLANSANQFPATTMWDTASYLNGMIAAHQLEVIDSSTFHNHMSRALRSLARIPLFQGKLPNKSYSTRTLDMIDYVGNASEEGIGWSALDIARILIPLRLVAWQYPEYADLSRQIVARWDMSSMLNQGVLYGFSESEEAEGALSIVQEGRLGYEEYGAKTMVMMGYDAFEALRYDDTVDFMDVYGVIVPTDGRRVEDWGANVYTTSEPHMLEGLELGFDRTSRAVAYAVFRAQEERYLKTGVLTAVTEGHIDQEPYFVYANVIGNGQKWATLAHDGLPNNDKRFLSTKAAFAWDALFPNRYTNRLLTEALAFHDPERGWYSGRYESTGIINQALTANSNGIILESLYHRASGPLFRLF